MFKVGIYFFILDRQPQWKIRFQSKSSTQGAWRWTFYRGES